jgi:hypothetical protein
MGRRLTLDPSQVETIQDTVIKLDRINDIGRIKSKSKFVNIAPGVSPYVYMNYNTLATFKYGFSSISFPLLPFLFLYYFLLTSTGRTGEPITKVRAHTPCMHT